MEHLGHAISRWCICSESVYVFDSLDVRAGVDLYRRKARRHLAPAALWAHADIMRQAARRVSQRAALPQRLRPCRWSLQAHWLSGDHARIANLQTMELHLQNCPDKGSLGTSYVSYKRWLARRCRTPRSSGERWGPPLKGGEALDSAWTMSGRSTQCRNCTV